METKCQTDTEPEVIYIIKQSDVPYPRQLMQLPKQLHPKTKQSKTLKPAPYIHRLNISRNAACPCGSGKKFKKCCINKEAVA